MRKLFVKAIEWLRSRVTAFVKVKGEGLKVKDTQGVYEDKNFLKVKGDRLETSKGQNSIAERPRNDDGKSFNSHLCFSPSGQRPKGSLGLRMTTDERSESRDKFA